MQIVLMWRARNSPASELGLERVATKLQQIFSPLFAETPKLRTFQNQALSLVYLELPVQGWRPAYLQEDDQTWSLSLDYPIHAKEALAGMGVHAPDDKVLPSLCRQMRLQPEPLLERMAPPFALIWAPKNAEEAFIQNDGLGYAQLFEYQDDQFWVMTNKIFALKALGITVKPVPEEWAVRSSMGWFPLKMTGFKNVRYPDPATQIHLTPRELTRKRFDVLSKWLKKDGLAVDECLELARSSINDYIQQASPLWDQASAGLTGGKDTRAIVSSLLACEAKNFYVRLRGQKTSYEVIIASQLAEIANLELRVEENHSLPPESVDSLKQMIGQALRWQAGYIEWRNHKIFLPLDRSYLLGGNINIMGQHGEVGRGNFTNHIKALDMTEDQYEDGLVAYLTQHKRPYLRPEYLNFVLETVRQAYRQADLYQLEGLDRLDFFHLFEKTRPLGKRGAICPARQGDRAISQSRLYPRHLQLARPTEGKQPFSPAHHQYQYAGLE